MGGRPRVSSHPIFVPHGENQLSAVLTVPEGPALGVAILPLRTPQLGIAGNVFWALAAARLADRSVASVRFEHAGSGDSTGRLAGGVTAIDEPVRETIAVAELAMDAVGLPTFMTAGSCLGGAIALQAARDERCRAVVSVNMALEEPGGPGRIRRGAADWRVVGAVRGRTSLRRALGYDRVRWWLRDELSPEGREAATIAARHARVLLVDDRELGTKGIADDESAAYEVRRDLSFGMIRVDAVELTPGEEHVLELLVEWLARPGAVSPEEPERAPSGDRAALGG